MPYSASAILAVYNAGSTLPACLDSLLAQTLPTQIIVVDDGSTDSTPSILKRYRKAVRVVRQKHQGPAIARNLGASFATAPILLFVDADMRFDRDYVKDLIEPILRSNRNPSKLNERSGVTPTEIVGTYTTEERVANWDNVWARCWNWQEGWAAGKRFPVSPPKWGTDFRAILKSDFERVGGFDNLGYTDTWSLFKKLGERPLSTQALCYHKNPGSLAAVYRQARWISKRPYKLGSIGLLVALVRTSFPVSLVVGLCKSALYLEPRFLVFKLVFDFGRFLGLCELLVSGNLAK